MKKSILLIAALMIAGLALASCSTLKTKDGKTVMVYINVESKVGGSMTVKKEKNLEQAKESLEIYLVKLMKKQGIAAVKIDNAGQYPKSSENYLLDVDMTNYTLEDTGRRTRVPYNPVPVAIYDQSLTAKYNLVGNAGSMGVSGSETARTTGPTSRITKAISIEVTNRAAQKIKAEHAK